MMNESKYRMVDYLDEPDRVLFFTINEFLSFMMPLGFCLGIHHPCLGLVLSIVILFLNNRFRAMNGDRFLQKAVYWYFPYQLTKLKWLPPSYLRQFIG